MVRSMMRLISSPRIIFVKYDTARWNWLIGRQSRCASSASCEPKKTCLHGFHAKKQARMEPFAGYSMPIVYKDQTIKSEHIQTRERASVFDVSHMMQVIIRGEHRCEFIEHLTVADLKSMNLDKCTLSVLTNQSGGIIDDCIISNRQDHLHIVSNAGNADTVWSWLQSNREIMKSKDIHLTRLVQRGLVALQGPKAAEVLQCFIKNINLSDIEFMNTTDAAIEGVGICQVTRCGYTGEDGFEISVDEELAETLVDLLISSDQVKPAGLGARDTLRLEASLCLHGHDITDKTTPVEAALNWTVHKRRRAEGGFIGSDVVLGQLKNRSKIKRVGLIATSGGPPAREGSKVVETVGGREIGTVTSGTLAPMLGKNIAMAYLPTSMATAFGQTVKCEIRGKGYEYEVTKMPFVKSNYYTKKT